MTTIPYTFCDLCNPSQSHTSSGRGYIVGGNAYARECGWKTKRDGSGVAKHVCPECKEEGRFST